MRILRSALAVLAAVMLVVTVAPPTSASTSDYVSFVRKELPDTRAVPRATIISLGKTICKGLNVLSVQQVVDSAEDTDLSTKEVSVLIVGAVVFICPKHEAKLQRWIDS